MTRKNNNLDIEFETLKLEQLKLHLEYAFGESCVNLKERVILINQEIDQDVFTMVEVALTELESYNRQPITIRICSEGGDEYVALAIVGRMQRSKCKIITEGYGQIMSAATLILAAGRQRKISRFATFMHHEAAYNTDGKHSNLKAEVEHMERLEQLWSTWMAEFSKKSKKFYYDEAKHTDKYWTPETVLEYGIVDEII